MTNMGMASVRKVHPHNMYKKKRRLVMDSLLAFVFFIRLCFLYVHIS